MEGSCTDSKYVSGLGKKPLLIVKLLLRDAIPLYISNFKRAWGNSTIDLFLLDRLDVYIFRLSINTRKLLRRTGHRYMFLPLFKVRIEKPS